MKEKDTRPNIKVSPKARKLLNILAAHQDKTQSDVIEELAESKCKELGIKNYEDKL